MNVEKIFNYYSQKDFLKIEQIGKFYFNRINNINDGMSNYKNKNQYNLFNNNSNNYHQGISHSIMDKNCSNEELYEQIGKYNIRKDKNKEVIYYNDNNKYFKKKIKKLKNFKIIQLVFLIGNSCYINSFLQILFHIPNFLNVLSEYDIEDYGQDDLIYNIFYLSKFPFNSEYLYKIKKIMGEVNSKYGAFEPGDSQSFAIDFLDKLISESKNENCKDQSMISRDESHYSKKNKFSNFVEKFNNKEDLIEKLFQFVEVSVGYNNLDSFSINLHVELDFPPNYVRSISLINLLNNKYNDKNKIADLPEILIISFNRGITGKEVIKTNVSFEQKLDMEPFIDKSLNNSKSLNYVLYGINERFGQSKNQGHYICFIKVNNVKWFRFSDLYVIESTPYLNSCDVFGLYYIRSDYLQKYT